MCKRYFRKKEPNCRKEDVEWIEMTGQEFYRFVKKPENKNRYFIDMDDVVLEVTDAEARWYRAEKDHSDYLKAQEEKWSILSIYALEDETECTGEEIIEDVSQNVEWEAIRAIEIDELRAALARIDSKSYALIHALYLAEQRKTERTLAREYGVSQIAIHKRKKKILKKLNSWLSKSKKVPNRK